MHTIFLSKLIKPLPLLSLTSHFSYDLIMEALSLVMLNGAWTRLEYMQIFPSKWYVQRSTNENWTTNQTT